MKKWLTKLLPSKPAPDTPGGRIANTAVMVTNLARVELRAGVVTLKSGEARCFLRVEGFTVHHASPERALAWLQGYARVLNALPGNAVLIARSKPGGLAPVVNQLGLAAKSGPLARLAADQRDHAVRTHEAGETRETRQYVALHSPKGNADALLRAAAACQQRLSEAGVRAELVTDRALAQALAEDWNPARPPTWRQDFVFPADSNSRLGTLVYAPRQTYVSGRTTNGAI